MYAIFSREAIKLMNGNRGKLPAQAGHAYLHAYWDSEARYSDREYQDIPEGKRGIETIYRAGPGTVYRKSGTTRKLSARVWGQPRDRCWPHMLQGAHDYVSRHRPDPGRGCWRGFEMSQSIDLILQQIDQVQDDLKKPGRYKFSRFPKKERELDCNIDRLYGKLDVAIEYLKEVQALHPTAMLDEHWTGYEDMEMRFVYHTTETDEEYELRLQSELYTHTARRADRDKRKHQEAIQKKINDLRKQL